MITETGFQYKMRLTSWSALDNSRGRGGAWRGFHLQEAYRLLHNKRQKVQAQVF